MNQFEMGQRMGLAAFLANARNDRAFDAADNMRPVIERLNNLNDIIHVGGARMRLHHYNHSVWSSN
jgi:hypothetical protein